MKIRVDVDVCVGHGRCYVLAPEVFEADEHGRCVLKFKDVPPDLEEKARRGEENCPEAAICIDDD
ncbi:MAG: ferredoxin [Myxococcales bacterium]|nr:ferredoxin [Myxococcales bacterium]